jgi:TonB-linked SusC/RagA family outer membrane protein
MTNSCLRKSTFFMLIILLLSFSLKVSAQGNLVTGTVIAEDDSSPLIGVNITNKKTNKKAVTNASGKFSIAAEKGETLVFSYTSYATKQVVVGDVKVINVTLAASEKQLDDVVVTAYGIKREKKSLGYSTQSVTGEDISATKRDNFINSLAGRVAGVNITPSSGTPGASTQIVLRGATSIGGNNQPLFVVDGVPYDNQTLNQEGLISGQSVAFGNRNSDYGNRAMDINPDDIEELTILKGPEATALYGSDGASGAIIITTKKGKAGKISVNYDNSFRSESIYRLPDVQTVYGIGSNGVANSTATVNPFSILGSATGAGISSAFGAKIPAGTNTYNNSKSFFKNGFTQQHNLNVGGGSENATYRFSAGYFNQDGVIPNTGYEKISFRFTGSTSYGKFKLNTTINYVNSTTKKASKGAGSYLINLLTWPVENDARNYVNPDGTKVTLRNVANNYSLEYDNPFWDVNKNPAQDKVDRLTGNINASFDITKWLSVSNILGIDQYSQYGYLATNPLSRFGYASNGFYSQYQQNTRNISNTVKATAIKRWNDFSVNFTAGFYVENNYTKLESQKGERFYERDFFSMNNTDPLSRDAKTTITQTRKTRLFGSLVSGYKNILYLSLSGSREGVSTFMSRAVDKSPYFSYGSSSLSFVFTELNFMKGIDWLNFGKARISYANTGKGPSSPYVIDYRFVNQITTGGGYAYDVTGNNFGLQPERSKNLEYGVEINAFKNRVKLDVTRYELVSEKQLLAARASYGTGYVIKWFNGGKVENKGWEIQLGITAIRNKNFTWQSNFNFDKNIGKVVSMPSDLPTYYDSDTWVFGNLRSQYFVGSKIGNLAANKFKRNDKGDILISPTTGLPIKDDNFTTVGDRQPDFKLGFVNKFTYKDFSLSFNLEWRKGGSVFNATEYLLYLTGYSTRTLDREKSRVVNGVLQDGLENTATPTRNTIAVTPMNNSTYYSGTTTTSEEDFVENVSWLRMRDITVAYRVPRKFLGNARIIKDASVFFTGTDLFMLTNYTGADPSVNSNTAANRGYGGAGIDYGALSIPRGFNFGIKIQL